MGMARQHLQNQRWVESTLCGRLDLCHCSGGYVTLLRSLATKTTPAEPESFDTNCFCFVSILLLHIVSLYKQSTQSTPTWTVHLELVFLHHCKNVALQVLTSLLCSVFDYICSTIIDLCAENNFEFEVNYDNSVCCVEEMLAIACCNMCAFLRPG